MTPDVSVIVTLQEHRGLAEECVASWAARQTFAAERSELVVVSPGTEARLEGRVRRLLRPQDRIVRLASGNLAELYKAGADAARGRVLLFTESHCVAEPECLGEVVRYLDESGLDGASCRSEPVCANALARMDERLFTEGYREGLRQGSWRLLNLHGVAVRREAYEAAGGFDVRYDRFAEPLLAARLRDAGRRLGLAERAVVRHHYRPSVGEKLAAIEGYVRGESLYRDDRRGDFELPVAGCLESGVLGALAPPAACRRVAAALRGAAAAELRHDRRLLRALAGPLLHYHFLGWVGGRGLEALAAAALLWAALRCRLWQRHEVRLERAYREHWQWAARLSRLRYLRRHPRVTGDLPATPGEWAVARLSDGCLVGGHVAERYRGEVFRWTAPVFALRLAVPPGDYRLLLATRGLRGHDGPGRLRVFFNRHELGPAAARVADGVLSAEVGPRHFDAGREQVLVVACEPLRPREHGQTDSRDLGLPLFTFAVEARALRRQAA